MIRDQNCILYKNAPVPLSVTARDADTAEHQLSSLIGVWLPDTVLLACIKEEMHAASCEVEKIKILYRSVAATEWESLLHHR